MIGGYLSVGQKVSVRRLFTPEDLDAFAAVTGDDNPLHVSPEFARHTAFGRPIVHGLLTASLFSYLLGTKLPGPGSIYLGQMLKFTAPVFVGEEVTASVEVAEINTAKRTVRLVTQATTARGVVLEGEAVIKMSRPLEPTA
ncbi:MAG TPA: MaoC family dehydratase [Chloroflexota bacterium]|nr:MaoC family dehydratase [Chloroflexota bacterium]